ncbi:MAG: zinc ABC transporter substrate-binding protein [Phycisphaerales bacterium]|nr:zinc ABC transporter substrate-binding protein [Phycisphaerales bacterium]
MGKDCGARRVGRAGLFGILAAVLTCTGGSTASADEARKLNVVTTVGMVTDIVRVVAGEHAEVVGIIGEGVDPHLYRASRNDVAKLQDADVIFYSGLLLEGRMSDTLVRMARGGRKVFAVTEGIDAKRLIEPEGADGHPDPHVWMDVSLWSRAVETVAEALSSCDEANAAAYRANASRYRGELAELDSYVKKVIASIPTRQRVLVTAHDAFGYFGRAYGIEVRGIQGISTESEAGVADINRLVAFLVERDISAVFVESSVAEKNVRALVEGAAARGRTVRIGGTLLSDAMGASGTYEGTYIGMIDHNATLIARALGGEAPERGWRGKLAEQKDR